MSTTILLFVIDTMQQARSCRFSLEKTTGNMAILLMEPMAAVTRKLSVSSSKNIPIGNHWLSCCARMVFRCTSATKSPHGFFFLYVSKSRGTQGITNAWLLYCGTEPIERYCFRFRKRNVILAALWHGSGHPPARAMLRIVQRQIDAMNNSGKIKLIS